MARMRSSTATARSSPPAMFPQLGPVVQVEETTAPTALAACMPSMMTSGVVCRRGEDPAAMKPAHAAGKDGFNQNRRL